MSMLGASNLRRVAGYDFHHLRKKYDAPGMWGNSPTMATVAAESGNQRAWLVPAFGEGRAALYQQV